MGNQAKVLDPGIFDELKAALTKFESEAGDSVRSAERAIQETRNWLDERFGYWSSEVNRKKRELEQARDALKRCQSSAQSSNDKDKREQKKDCSAEAQAIMQAKRALEEAETNLKLVKGLKGKFANLEDNFRAKAQNFKQFVSNNVQGGKNTLNSIESDLSVYTSLAPTAALMKSAALKSVGGQARYGLGKEGEKIASKILEAEFGMTNSQITNAQGVDIKGLSKDNHTAIVAEVKTHIGDAEFEDLLNKAYGGHVQMSDSWLVASAPNQDYTTARKLGVFINAETNTVSVYRRVDGAANIWKNLINNKPLSDYDL